MAEVIHLELGAAPPADASCLVVTRDITGGFYALKPEPDGVFTAPGPLIQPLSEADRSAAIERAKVHADQNGLRKIYVVS
jgi:hypothetical protein